MPGEDNAGKRLSGFFSSQLLCCIILAAEELLRKKAQSKSYNSFPWGSAVSLSLSPCTEVAETLTKQAFGLHLSDVWSPEMKSPDPYLSKQQQRPSPRATSDHKTTWITIPLWSSCSSRPPRRTANVLIWFLPRLILFIETVVSQCTRGEVFLIRHVN